MDGKKIGATIVGGVIGSVVGFGIASLLADNKYAKLMGPAFGLTVALAVYTRYKPSVAGSDTDAGYSNAIGKGGWATGGSYLPSFPASSSGSSAKTERKKLWPKYSKVQKSDSKERKDISLDTRILY